MHIISYRLSHITTTQRSLSPYHGPSNSTSHQPCVNGDWPLSMGNWLVGLSLKALSTQFRSYRAFIIGKTQLPNFYPTPKASPQTSASFPSKRRQHHAHPSSWAAPASATTSAINRSPSGWLATLLRAGLGETSHRQME